MKIVVKQLGKKPAEDAILMQNDIGESITVQRGSIIRLVVLLHAISVMSKLGDFVEEGKSEH